MTHESKLDPQKMAELAGSMASMHVDALDALGPLGLTWEDLVFASILSLKAVSQMKGDKDGSRLLEVVQAALSQEVLGKHFENEDQAKAWLEREGLIQPEGPVH